MIGILALERVQLEDLLLNKVLQIGGHLLWRLEVVPGESRPLGAKAEFAIWIERIPASGERHGNHTHRPQIHFGRVIWAEKALRRKVTILARTVLRLLEVERERKAKENDLAITITATTTKIS